MITFISGFINHKDHENNSIIIVNNGIGYEVTVKDPQVYHNTQYIQLWISTIQREDGITLYGFSKHEQRKLFNLLLNVQGVGPKTAMLLLNKYEPPEFYKKIKHIMINVCNKNMVEEIGIKGIGLKAAVKIVNAISKVLSSQNI